MGQTTFNQRFKVLIEFYNLRNSDVARSMRVNGRTDCKLSAKDTAYG